MITLGPTLGGLSVAAVSAGAALVVRTRYEDGVL